MFIPAKSRLGLLGDDGANLVKGLPGVGKTLTAESVAMLAGKPLFSVGVSDIGIEGAKVESNLQKVFDLAGLWEAVLLLYVFHPHIINFLLTSSEATRPMCSLKRAAQARMT